MDKQVADASAKIECSHFEMNRHMDNQHITAGFIQHRLGFWICRSWIVSRMMDASCSGDFLDESVPYAGGIAKGAGGMPLHQFKATI